jgi:hypothetical protein
MSSSTWHELIANLSVSDLVRDSTERAERIALATSAAGSAEAVDGPKTGRPASPAPVRSVSVDTAPAAGMFEKKQLFFLFLAAPFLPLVRRF